MAAINPPKYSKKEVSQRFNLKELLGYEPSEDQKKLFYELAVDAMAQRTLNGSDIDGRSFKPYSPEYAKSKGVSVNSVDLVLTGEMLSSFEESQGQKNVVKIKIQDGDNTLKAYNHNVGDTLPKRLFFGLKDVGKIVKRVDSLKEDTRQERKQKIDLAAIRSALNDIRIETEGFNGEDQD
jgi:hypothetical protein